MFIMIILYKHNNISKTNMRNIIRLNTICCKKTLPLIEKSINRFCSMWNKWKTNAHREFNDSSPTEMKTNKTVSVSLVPWGATQCVWIVLAHIEERINVTKSFFMFFPHTILYLYRFALRSFSYSITGITSQEDFL